MPADNTSLEVQTALMELYRTVAANNEEAFRFIIAWQHFCHNIDDDVDGQNGMDKVENKIANYFQAAAIYSSNYYTKNAAHLFILIPLISSDYIDSNGNIPQSTFLKGTGNNMLKAVAFIEGGWDLLRKVSPILNNLSYTEHTIKGH